MIIGVPKELASSENRVALTPDVLKAVKALGFEIWVEKGAGERASFSDSLYEAQGAKIVNDPRALWSQSQIVVKIGLPTSQELSFLSANSIYIGFLQPFAQTELTQILVKQKATSFALELVPRISRAQSVDALSSQASIAGYKAVLVAASELGKYFPMLTTAAGTIPPSKVVILGVGVAGLQAIATAKRLGAVVEAYDVRPEVKEQVLSLGAKFIEVNLTESGSGEGGYAKEITAEKLQELVFVFNRVHRVICMNHESKRKLIKQGVHEDRLEVLIGGADPELFPFHERGRGAIGFCTAFYSRKSPDKILEIIQKMPQEKFILLGPQNRDGEFTKRHWSSYKRFNELLAQPNLQYVECPYSDYPKYYAQMDIFVSVSQVEGGPIPLIESMMSNCFPVVSRVGFAPDIIQGDSSGLLFDPEATADHIVHLICQARIRKENIRNSALPYTWRNFVKGVQRNLREAIHIGMGKSASSFLQQRIFSHPSFDTRVHSDERWTTYFRRSKANPSEVDHIDIQKFQYEKCKELATRFPKSPVLLITRSWIPWCQSLYKGYKRDGGNDAWPLFMHKNAAYLIQMCNYDYLIQIYQTAFGAKNVYCLPYELLKNKPHAFLKTLCQTIQCEPIELETFDIVNPSLSIQLENKITLDFDAIGTFQKQCQLLKNHAAFDAYADYYWNLNRV